MDEQTFTKLKTLDRTVLVKNLGAVEATKLERLIRQSNSFENLSVEDQRWIAGKASLLNLGFGEDGWPRKT